MNTFNTSLALKIGAGVLLVLVLGFGVFKLAGGKSESKKVRGPDVGYTAMGQPTAEELQETTSKDKSGEVATWDNNPDTGWKLIYGTAPKCKDPYIVTPPTDLTKVTSVLYPGQTRQLTDMESSFT